MGAVGTLGAAVENSVGNITLGTNGQIYQSGWRGNKYVATTSVRSVARMAGHVTLVGGTIADGVSVANGELSAGHAGVNLGVGLWGMFGGPFTWVPAAGYFGLDNFYPGGFEQAMQDKAGTDARMMKIDPSWLHPGAN